MKTLLIMRHAKSSWKQAELNDHQRPLNARGLRDAPRMGALLRQEQLVPDRIISSTAQRARQTVGSLIETSGFHGEIDWTDTFYLAPPDAYRAALHQIDDGHQRVMVVGHNPGLEDLILELTGRDEAMPTAALAQVTLSIDDWQEVEFLRDASLSGHWCPRDLS